MYFGNFRDHSVKVGKYKKASDVFRKTSDAFRQRSSSWRPLTECSRRFPEGKHYFYYFLSLPSSHENCRSEYRHRTKCFEVHYTPISLTVFIKHTPFFGLACIRITHRPTRRLIRVQTICICLLPWEGITTTDTNTQTDDIHADSQIDRHWVR